MDLITMPEEAVHDNLGYSYVPCVVDIFSKYDFNGTAKAKSAKEVVRALEGILQEGEAPHIIQSDNGGEFKNYPMSGLRVTYG